MLSLGLRFVAFALLGPRGDFFFGLAGRLLRVWSMM